jgi:hypothetical protein
MQIEVRVLLEVDTFTALVMAGSKGFLDWHRDVLMCEYDYHHWQRRASNKSVPTAHNNVGVERGQQQRLEKHEVVGYRWSSFVLEKKRWVREIERHMQALPLTIYSPCCLLVLPLQVFLKCGRSLSEQEPVEV